MSEQLRLDGSERGLLHAMLFLHKADFWIRRRIEFGKELHQSVHCLIAACKQTCFHRVFRQIDLNAFSITLSIHC